MFIRISFATLVLAVAALGVPVKRYPTRVEQDFTQLDGEAKALEVAISAFPTNGGTLSEISVIHKTTETLDKSIKTTTNDVIASSGFTDAETKSILDIVKEQLEPVVLSGSNALVQKKSAVSALSAQNVALSDLNTIKTDVGELEVAVIPKVPASAQSDFMEPFTAMKDALASAIHEYSS